MLLSQGVLEHVGQRSSPGLTPDWQLAGKQKPHTSTDFCDHSCATQLSSVQSRCRGCSGRCRPCYPVWDTSLVSSFSRKGKTKSANIRFLSGGLKSKERTSSRHCLNSCPLQAASSLAIHLYEVRTPDPGQAVA